MEKWLKVERKRRYDEAGGDYGRGYADAITTTLAEFRRRTVAVGKLETHSVLGEPLIFLNVGEDTLISLAQIAYETSGKRLRIILEEEDANS